MQTQSATRLRDRQEARNSQAYKTAKKQLQSRAWRLDNLYWIKDKDGEEVPFRRNASQRAFAAELWFRNTLVKARQLGFSTDIAMQMTDDLIFRPNTVAAIIDYKLPDAEKKLDKVRFAYEKLPAAIRSAVRAVKDNDAEMTFTNGSSVTVGTSFRGDTPQVLHVSEYGKISVENPKAANEIKTGAIQAVGMNGKVDIESTAHGVGGEFYDNVQLAEKKKKEGTPLTRLDFKLHFYGWHIDPGYRLQPNLVIVPKEVNEYFQELRGNHGLIVDARQVAWYANQLEKLGPDDMKSEYPSIMEEAFFNSLEGAFFKRQMSQARIDKRIGHAVPYDPTRPVNTFCDLGVANNNAIWFHQSDGVRHRFIDFALVDGLGGFMTAIDERRQKRQFIYGRHYGPHDLEVTEWANPSMKTRKETAKTFGIDFIVVPRVAVKAEAIEAARRFIGMSWFDEVNCKEGIKALDNYRKSWDDKLGVWKNEPVGDWASHPADAYMTGAMGWTPEAGLKPPKPREESKGSAWSS